MRTVSSLLPAASFASCASAFWLRPDAITWKPCFARCRAALQPIPVVAPVIRTICCFEGCDMLVLLGLWVAREMNVHSAKGSKKSGFLDPNRLPHTRLGRVEHRLSQLQLAFPAGTNQPDEGAIHQRDDDLGIQRLHDLPPLAFLDERLHRTQQHALEIAACLIEIGAVMVQLEERQHLRVFASKT